MLKSFMDISKAKIIASKKLVISRELAQKHYKHLSEKPFFDWIIRYITCYDAFAFIIETPVSADEIRSGLGSTMVEKAEKQSLRGKYGLRAGMNGLHVSESETVATEEIKLWEESGALKEGSLQFDVGSYTSEYGNSLDNTSRIHDFFDKLKDKGEIRSKASKEFLYSALKDEAIGVEDHAFDRFFGIFWDMLM